MPGLRAFLSEVDGLWRLPTEKKIRLQIIGSAALMLQADYDRGTKDSDILETAELTPEVKTHLLGLAGENTALHSRHRIYIQLVPMGIPFLAQVPRWLDRPEIHQSLRHCHVEVLDVVDVVVSKLKRFNSNDVTDIDAMIARDLVHHEALVSRFNAAVESYQMDSRADDLHKYVRNLHTVERDMLGVDESEIVLPGWI